MSAASASEDREVAELVARVMEYGVADYVPVKNHEWVYAQENLGLMTLKKAAALAGVNVKTIKLARDQGLIKTYKVGSWHGYKKGDIDKFLKHRDEKKPGKHGVYLIRCKGLVFDHVRVKIGVTNNPEKRIETMQTGSPLPLQLDRVVWCMGRSDAGLLERSMHQLYKKQRLHGEWFSFPEGNYRAILCGFRL